MEDYSERIRTGLFFTDDNLASSFGDRRRCALIAPARERLLVGLFLNAMENFK
jgi:hypothetical protein